MSEDVFIFHGRDDAAYDSLATFCSRLGLEPHNFRQRVAGEGPNQTLEIITRGVADAKAIILLLTPDEYMALDPGCALPMDGEAEMRGWAPRPNVLFEAGFAFGAGRTKTIPTRFAYPGRRSVALSNIDGINIITLNEPSALNRPSGAAQLVTALRRHVTIAPERVEAVLGMAGFGLPRPAESLAKVAWPDPFVAPPPPPPQSLPPVPRDPTPRIAAALVVGLGVGAAVSWAALGPKSNGRGNPPSSSTTATSSTTAPSVTTAPTVTTVTPTAQPSVIAPCPSLPPSTGTPTAALLQCQKDKEVCKEQLAVAARAAPGPGMVVCEKCEMPRGPRQCCPDGTHFTTCL
jgi:hypothetical protein